MLWSTFKRQLSLQFFCLTLLISFLYASTAILLPNYKLVWTTLSGGYSGVYKVTLLTDLLLGAWESVPHLTLILTFISALFFGITLSLALLTVERQKKSVVIPITTGGSSMVLIAGCPSCGFSLLSLLWPSFTLSFLPFQGVEIQLLGIGILVYACYSVLRKIANGSSCEVKQ